MGDVQTLTSQTLPHCHRLALSDGGGPARRAAGLLCIKLHCMPWLDAQGNQLQWLDEQWNHLQCPDEPGNPLQCPDEQWNHLQWPDEWWQHSYEARSLCLPVTVRTQV